MMISKGVLPFLGLLSVFALIFLFTALRKYKIAMFLRKLICSLSGAAIVGGSGFVLGILGARALDPKNAEAEFLGVLVTGPLGALLGLILGWVYPKTKRDSGSSKSK